MFDEKLAVIRSLEAGASYSDANATVPWLVAWVLLMGSLPDQPTARSLSRISDVESSAASSRVSQVERVAISAR